MQKPYPGVKVEVPNSDVKDIGYGLGGGTGVYKGLNLVEHSGGYPGVKAFVRMIPSKKLGIVCLVNLNGTDVMGICQKATDILLDI